MEKVYEIQYNGDTLVAYADKKEADQKAKALSDWFMDDGYQVVEVEKEPII